MNQIKTLILFCIVSVFLPATLFSAIDADVDLAIYYQDGSPYVDVRLHIIASTVTAKELENNQIQTRVNVLITILKDEEIIDFQKYGLVSPSAEKASDFIDLRRFVLPKGNFVVRVELQDQLNSKNMFITEKALEVSKLSDDKMEMSAISLISNVIPSKDVDNPFFKYGNLLEPAAFGFFHQAMDHLYVFSEVYNSDKLFDAGFVARLTITNLDDTQFKPLQLYKKLKPSDKTIILERFSIVDLTSGNYQLDIELLNPKQEVKFGKTVFFQRSNPRKDNDVLLSNNFNLEGSFINSLTLEELEYNLKALAPRLNQMEITTVNTLLADDNVKGQRFYLYNYWSAFDPVTTEETFNTYKKIAEAVDRKFYNTVGRGFETDRGYIFLKYGKPKDVISVENEPSAPPYEIWFYDILDLTGENNVKFLFYNPTLGGNDYTLLHSTTRYERRNPRWEVELYSDAPKEIDGNRVDATSMKDGFNRRAREYFEDNN